MKEIREKNNDNIGRPESHFKIQSTGRMCCEKQINSAYSLA